MTRHRIATVAVGAVAAVTALVIPAQVASASSSHGTIRVHVLVEGHPSKGIKVCATTKAAPAKSAVKGTCHKTNSHGYVTLTRVAHGHWFVTLYDGSTPEQSSPHKVAVHAGKVTSYTFKEQVG